MKPRVRHGLVVLATLMASLALLGSLEHGLSAQEAPRETAACLECHGGMDTTLVRSAHAVAAPSGAPVPRIGCTDCHGTDRRHWEEGPTEYPMTNPATVSAADAALLCASCHQNSHQQDMRAGNVHAANDLNCSTCHRIHGNTQTSLLQKPQDRLCYGCHGDVEAQFARSYRHPVAEGTVRCSDCHTTIGAMPRDLTSSGVMACTKCHGEFEGPFPHEHAATLGYSTDETGCLACHEPHGSHQPRMLRQPYEAPHYQLCSQCHSVPRHNANAMHGTRWAGRACGDCHTDIHGSYDNRHLLSPSLQGEGCLKAGCHGS